MKRLDYDAYLKLDFEGRRKVEAWCSKHQIGGHRTVKIWEEMRSGHVVVFVECLKLDRNGKLVLNGNGKPVFQRLFVDDEFPI